MLTSAPGYHTRCQSSLLSSMGLAWPCSACVGPSGRRGDCNRDVSAPYVEGTSDARSRRQSHLLPVACMDTSSKQATGQCFAISHRPGHWREHMDELRFTEEPVRWFAGTRRYLDRVLCRWEGSACIRTIGGGDPGRVAGRDARRRLCVRGTRGEQRGATGCRECTSEESRGAGLNGCASACGSARRGPSALAARRE
ncbi:hypothetical protein K466DRAFT_10508 [Polyporus arcularius HHB13444]|uniref:Uncharacterized protein n=1 Tax=Polyporus arcularius HHB13444 TaxID=1314778 RepID=A0A5C3NQS4_9APHY|nr:hypothetical protein K466DRAFT_10508 [Polyporus arcularius HHB13444]